MKARTKSVSLFVLASLIVAMSFVTLAQNAAPAYLQVRAIPHGAVQSVAYKSKALGTDRKMIRSGAFAVSGLIRAVN